MQFMPATWQRVRPRRRRPRPARRDPRRRELPAASGARRDEARALCPTTGRSSTSTRSRRYARRIRPTRTLLPLLRLAGLRAHAVGRPADHRPVTRFVCATCGTQFPRRSSRRRPARSARTSASTCPRTARSGRRSTSCATGHAPRSGEERAGLLGDRHRAVVRDRPARAPRPPTATCSGTACRCSTTRPSRAIGARRARRDRDLAPALLLDDGRVGQAFDVPGLPPRGRPRVGHAARPGDRLLGGRDARARPGLTLIRSAATSPAGRCCTGRRATARRCSPATPQVVADRGGSASCTATRT